MSERELHAEIVKSGTWLYDEQVPSEVWIVKQDFEYHYEEDFSDGPEQLNRECDFSGLCPESPLIVRTQWNAVTLSPGRGSRRRSSA
jgi:hypothetical protein